MVPGVSSARLGREGKCCSDRSLRELQKDRGIANGREVGFKVLYRGGCGVAMGSGRGV